MVFLACQGLAHQSIVAYLSGVRNLAIASGDTPVDRDQMPRLQLVLWGVARSSSHQGGRRPCLPITGTIMHQLLGVWSGDNFESRLMWVATCVGYFRFMRAGEFTAVCTAPPPLQYAYGSAEPRLTPLVGALRFIWVFQVWRCARSQP